MSFTLQRIKSLILPKETTENEEASPEIGFKIIYYSDNEELIVKVIGVRNLPSSYGNVKPQGYVVKVKVFPGREKFESEIFKDSWSCINQKFKFPLKINSMDQFSGKFVTLTVYAVLDQQDGKSKLKTRSSFKEHIDAFIDTMQDVEMRKDPVARRTNSSRFSMNNRRTIGVVTYNLEKHVFGNELRDHGRSTPDIWRIPQNITSGVKSESRESKKGCLEVTMAYSNSEDGKNDMVQVSLSKFRCSMQTMQDHEKIKGSLYIKMEASECDVVIAKWKSDTFVPTISMKIESNTATMQALVHNYNLDRVQISIKIKCKNILSKKVLLGQIVISNNSYIWKQIMESPTIPCTHMFDFE